MAAIELTHSQDNRSVPDAFLGLLPLPSALTLRLSSTRPSQEHFLLLRYDEQAQRCGHSSSDCPAVSALLFNPRFLGCNATMADRPLLWADESLPRARLLEDLRQTDASI